VWSAGRVGGVLPLPLTELVYFGEGNLFISPKATCLSRRRQNAGFSPAFIYEAEGFV
jgi:hypothetical protein